MKEYGKHYIPLLACLILMLAVTYACQKKEAESIANEITAETAQAPAGIAELLTSLNMYHFKEPVKAPDFELPSLTGEKVSISQYHGNTVLLSFWATW